MRTGIWRGQFERGLGGLLALNLVLLVVRILFFGRLTYAFLAWNLALASVPYGFARLLEWQHERTNSSPFWLAPIVLGWLFFFPNAPYIFTDYIHLERLTNPHEWLFNILLVSLFAVTGLLFGLWSFFLVHEVIRERLGRLTGWLVVIGVSLVSGYGVYLGRFPRWNSWDVITHPLRLFQDASFRLAHPLGYPNLLLTTVLFAGFVFSAYLVFRGLIWLLVWRRRE